MRTGFYRPPGIADRNATVTESDGKIYVTRGDRTIATFDEGALEYWDNEN